MFPRGIAFGQNYGQPAIFDRGLVNSASFMAAGLPGGSIAQGSTFSIFGQNLGPSSSPPLSYFGTEIWNVCVPAPGVGSEKITVAVGPGGDAKDIAEDTPGDLSDCGHSVGTYNEVDPSAIQATFGTTRSGTTGSLTEAGAKATASPQHPVNALPYVRPLPFRRNFPRPIRR